MRAVCWGGPGWWWQAEMQVMSWRLLGTASAPNSDVSSLAVSSDQRGQSLLRSVSGPDSRKWVSGPSEPEPWFDVTGSRIWSSEDGPRRWTHLSRGIISDWESHLNFQFIRIELMANSGWKFYLKPETSRYIQWISLTSPLILTRRSSQTKVEPWY